MVKMEVASSFYALCLIATHNLYVHMESNGDKGVSTALDFSCSNEKHLVFHLLGLVYMGLVNLRSASFVK